MSIWRAECHLLSSLSEQVAMFLMARGLRWKQPGPGTRYAEPMEIRQQAKRRAGSGPNGDIMAPAFPFPSPSPHFWFN